MHLVGGIPPLDGSAQDGDVSQPGASGSAQGTVKTEARDLTNQEQGQLVSILTQLSQSVQQKAGAVQAKRNVEQSVIDLASLINSMDLTETAKADINRLVQVIGDQGGIDFETPNFVTQMRPPALKEKYDDNKGVVSKLIHKITKFNGTDPKYKWAKFWTA